MAADAVLELTGQLVQSSKRRGGLSGFLRHRQIRELLPVVFTRDAADTGPLPIVTVRDALATVPRRTGEIQDALLVAIARMIKTPGGMVRLTDDHAPLAYSLDPADFGWHLRQLVARGLVQHARGNDEYNLAHKGWEVVDELDRGSVQDFEQAFVAMWFDDRMDGVYRDGIAPAIQASGFKPYLIKNVEHNNKICDEILAEIRRSRFLVADFTGNRGGAYFEAGFAMGLGLPVIWTVHKDHLAEVHFDTNHFNHIAWTSPEELRARLESRVRATIPPPASR